MTDEHTEVFEWGDLGEQWWLDVGAQCRATSQQIKFACARHLGATATGAARLAGYAGTYDSIRQSAYKASHSTAVANMLALAGAEDKTIQPKVLDKAGRAEKLSKMAHGPDPSLSIRAIEGLNKMDERDVELGQAITDDGFGNWRMVRDYLQMGNGAAAIVYLWAGLGNGLSSCPLLHDVHKAVLRSEPELWDRVVKTLSASERLTLRRQLDKPEWQLEARIKIWKEVGKDIEVPIGWHPEVSRWSADEQTVVGSINGWAKPAPASAAE